MAGFLKKDKTDKPKNRIKRAAKGLLIVFILLVGIYVVSINNPRVKLFISTLVFSETTLKEPSYIAYDIDLMELCQEYLNADTAIYGKARIHDMDGFGFSSSMEVKGERSFSQKKINCTADMKVLFIEVGEFDMYVDDDTMYMVVPMLDDLSYAFTTGKTLFPKAPELTSDISQEWFRSHMGDIVELMGQISIGRNGKSAGDGMARANGYHMVIPEGAGGFIWELLGMDAPDHDIVADIYIDSAFKVRRIEFDLSEVTEGATMVLDGDNLSTCVYQKELPDNELFTVKMVRNAKYTYTNCMDCSMEYDTFKGDVITAETYMTWEKAEDGVELKIHDTAIKKNDDIMANCSFTGRLEKINKTEDVFSGVDVDFGAIELMEWRELRDDTEGFIDDVMDEVRDRTGL